MFNNKPEKPVFSNKELSYLELALNHFLYCKDTYKDECDLLAPIHKKIVDYREKYQEALG